MNTLCYKSESCIFFWKYFCRYWNIQRSRRAFKSKTRTRFTKISILTMAEIHLTISPFDHEIEREVTKGARVHDCSLMLTNDCNCRSLEASSVHTRGNACVQHCCLICFVSHPGTSTAYVPRRCRANTAGNVWTPLHYPIWSCQVAVSVNWWTRCDVRMQ